jgi:hypothetical protein
MTMIRKLSLFAALAFVGTSLYAQTADEVISKYIAVRGGLEKIKAVKSERISGTVSFGPEAEGSFVLERQRPLKMHMQFTVGGMTVIRVYAGQSAGWFYNPLVPNPTVQPMTDSDLRGVFDEADFDGPFVDYKAKGNQVEFVDKEEVLGKTAYKIKLTNKFGDVGYFFFAADTNLPLKWEGERKIADKAMPWETYYSDFREVNGLKYPFVVESDSPGSEDHQKITTDKVEQNVSIDASQFAKPNPPALPAAPANPPSAASPAEPAAPSKPDN